MERNRIGHLFKAVNARASAAGTYNFADEAIWQSGGKLYVTYEMARGESEGHVRGPGAQQQNYGPGPAHVRDKYRQ